MKNYTIINTAINRRLLIQQPNLLLYSATILCYITLLYYNGYSNLDDMIPLLQQPTIPLYMTWYNNLYVMTLIQLPSLLLGNNWLNKLPYNLMILLENLIHYYTTMNTATLTIWYFCYNNQLYHYTWLDTTIFTL